MRRFSLALPFLLAACATDGAAERESAMPSTDAPRVDVPHPDTLKGQTGDGLRTLLGEPALLRREAGAEVWQYPGESCVLLLYLYENGAGVPEVTYLEARRKTKGPAPLDLCLEEAVRAQALAPKAPRGG